MACIKFLYNIREFNALQYIPVESNPLFDQNPMQCIVFQLKMEGFYCLILAGLTQVFYTFRGNLGYITV